MINIKHGIHNAQIRGPKSQGSFKMCSDQELITASKELKPSPELVG